MPQYDWAKMTPRERDSLVHYRVMEKTMSMTGLTKHIPHYTTDISAAWEVVEKMLSEKVSVEVKHYAYPGAEWIAGVRSIQAMAESAPEAICLAALRAKGVDM